MLFLRGLNGDVSLKNKVEEVPTLAKIFYRLCFPDPPPLHPCPPGIALCNEAFTLGPRKEQNDSI